jgi:hypothetical protein
MCAAASALFIASQAVAQTPAPSRGPPGGVGPTGVNGNFVGTFSAPIVVLNDPTTVFTLSQGTAQIDHFGAAKWQFYHLTVVAATFGNLFITFENGDQPTVYAAGHTPPSGPGFAIDEIGVVTGGVGRFA